MAQPLTVEMDDREMLLLQGAARGRGVDPARMTKAQLISMLAAPLVVAPADEAVATKRAKRLAAVMAMHGIWKDDPTKPKDPVAYQREVRSEWR